MHSDIKSRKKAKPTKKKSVLPKKEKSSDDFSLLIVGTGGQGQITLLNVLAEACLVENFDFRSSELHGLSQRGGSVKVHIRFGKKVNSPLVPKAGADLIISLEMQEALTSFIFSGPETRFLINKKLIPIFSGKSLTEKEVLNVLEKSGNEVYLVPAEEICLEELGNSLVAGIYLISFASFNNLIPLKPESILKAIKKVVPKKFLELNVKAFNLSSKKS